MNTRIIHCPVCSGDKGHAYPVDIDRRDGSLIERWEPCETCQSTGEIEVELEPISLGDLDDMEHEAKYKEHPCNQAKAKPVTNYTLAWYAVDEIGNDNFATSIYEAGDKGLLVARCNQNGQYPWQAAAILRGLERNKDISTVTLTDGKQP